MTHLFLSYSRKDTDILDKLVDSLKVAGYEVWFDREGIQGGSQWRKQIVMAIDDCAAFLLILSPNSAASDNVRKEIDLAEDKKRPIFPILIEETTIPPEMEYQLAGLQWIDVSKQSHIDYEYVASSLAAKNILPTSTAETVAPHLDEWVKLILEDVGKKKLPVSKSLREITKFGPKEINDLMRNTPSTILAGVKKPEAETAKIILEKFGATVRIEPV